MLPTNPEPTTTQPPAKKSRGRPRRVDGTTPASEVEQAEIEPEFIDRREARRIIKISDVTFWRLEREGRLRSYRLGLKAYYRAADVRALIERSAP